MKELKDYLHLYLGCKCKTKDGIMELSSIDLNNKFPIWFNCKWNDKSLSYIPDGNSEILLKDNCVGKGFYYSQVKPILRHLRDITDEERNEAYTLKGENAFNEFEGETIKWLLSKHFDLFNLIEAGIAIDKTTLK